MWGSQVQVSPVTANTLEHGLGHLLLPLTESAHLREDQKSEIQHSTHPETESQVILGHHLLYLVLLAI